MFATHQRKKIEWEWDWLLNVTCNDISVIYVTAHLWAGGLKRKLDLRSGSQSNRHFKRFFNVPIQAPTESQPFKGYSEKLPHFSRLLRCALGYWGPVFVLKPQGPGGRNWKYSVFIMVSRVEKPSPLVKIHHFRWSYNDIGACKKPPPLS